MGLTPINISINNKYLNTLNRIIIILPILLIG